MRKINGLRQRDCIKITRSLQAAFANVNRTLKNAVLQSNPFAFAGDIGETLLKCMANTSVAI